MVLLFWAVNHSVSERSEWLDLNQDYDPIAQESLSVSSTKLLFKSYLKTAVVMDIRNVFNCVKISTTIRNDIAIKTI